MQFIKSLTKLLFFICPAIATAQSTFLTPGSKDIHFVDRMEIKQQKNTHLNFSSVRPFNRKYIVDQTEFIDSARLGYVNTLTGRDKYEEWNSQAFTSIDEYNLNSFLMNNSEWVTGSKKEFLSKRPVLKNFYTTKPNFLEVNTKNFFLALNPVFQYVHGVETGYNKSIFLNSKGITLRGTIGRKIGFSTFLTDNQERGPQFFQQQVNHFRAVPGVGFYKPFKTTGVDYFDARGYITFKAAGAIDIQFGYDKNFIGNGYRSLLLSDWGNSNLFLKLNTRIWKLNYQNIFMELMPQFKKAGDTLLDRKYAAMHHLSMNVTKWLNIGVFEGVIFGRKNHFDFQYLNPIIFYRHIEGTVGSPDNAVAGIDFKANIGHRAQLYGQFLLDEFILSEIKNNPTSWVNKWGLQVGVKYVDAFGVPNLDIQLETNRVRPFTYTHSDTISNYTHYNQPLAHPLGANFQEFLGIIRYQPAPKWHVYLQGIFYTQGLDSTGKNFGGNIFRDYTTRTMNSGFKIGSGDKATVLNTYLQVSYEIRENIFFEVTGLYRHFKTLNNPAAQTTTLFTGGVRINMFNRRYDY
ncbi:MAG: capsule assembly Wzi family protein [Ferruginibacter sp.]